MGIRAKTGRYHRGDLWDARGATYGMPWGRTTTNGQSVVGVSLGQKMRFVRYANTSFDAGNLLCPEILIAGADTRTRRDVGKDTIPDTNSSGYDTIRGE